MLAYLFILFAIAVRFLPHPLAFTPVAASLLFFGARGSRRQLWIPLALLAASDVVLTKAVYGYPLSWDHFVTWAWYGAVLLLGARLRENSKWLWIAASAVASSVSFYLLSNFAVWACWSMYPKTAAGLMTSYLVGLPYFQRSLVGDLLFTAAMFAVPVVVNQLSQKSRGSAGPATV